MEETSFIAIFITYMTHVTLMAGVPLGVATVAGLVVSFLQAITQIQDQTLSQTIKIVAIVLVLLAFGSVLVGPFLSSTSQLFADFSDLVR